MNTSGKMSSTLETFLIAGFTYAGSYASQQRGHLLLSPFPHSACFRSAVYRGNEHVHKVDLSNFDDRNLRDYVSQDDNEGSESEEEPNTAMNSAAAQNNIACE